MATEPTAAVTPIEAAAAGDRLFAQRSWAEAAAAYQRAVDGGAPLRPLLHRLMATWKELGDLDSLDTAAQRALDLDAADADALYWRGFVAHRRDDLDGAVRHFRAALAALPGHRAAAGGLSAVEAAKEAAARRAPRRDAADGGTEQGAAGSGDAQRTPPGPATAPRLTLAEVIDKQRGLGDLNGEVHEPSCRPLRRSMVTDSWPALALIVVWRALPHRETGWLWPIVADVRPVLPYVAVFVVVYAVLRWYTTEYRIYERRVEVHAGVLFRRHQVLWLYEISRPVVFTQSLPQILLDTGTIMIESPSLPHRRPTFLFGLLQSGNGQALDPWGRLKLAAIKPSEDAQHLADELRRGILRERRSMLANFIGNP